jgi:hypothetical protein
LKISRSVVIRIIVAGMLGAVIGFLAGFAFVWLAPRAYVTTARFVILVAPITGALGIAFAACSTEAIRQFSARRVFENPSRNAKIAIDTGIYMLGGMIGGAMMAALFEFGLVSIFLGLDGNLLLGLSVGILVGGVAAFPAGVIGGILVLILGGLGLLADKITGERFLFGIAGTSLAAALGALPVMLFFAVFNV